MIAYRLVHPKHTLSAWSGEGAFRHGGRWNPPGTRVVYASSNVALALLELLAYRKARKPLGVRHLYHTVLAEHQITWLGPHELPIDWVSYPHPESTQQLGLAWLESGATLALAVPSVLVPNEANLVLNCAHTDFTHLDITGPEDFPISSRLMPDALT